MGEGMVDMSLFLKKNLYEITQLLVKLGLLNYKDEYDNLRVTYHSDNGARGH